MTTFLCSSFFPVAPRDGFGILLWHDSFICLFVFSSMPRYWATGHGNSNHGDFGSRIPDQMLPTQQGDPEKLGFLGLDSWGGF